ncbi:MAG: VOC family protein [Janthinobacterium lividum]
MTFTIDRIDHLVLNVADVEVSAAWYQKVLGMQREEMPGRSGPRVAMRFGRQKLNLRPVEIDQKTWFTADHPVAGSDDLCFITEVDPASVSAHLQALGIAVEVGPIERAGATGPMTSVYCRDPDGNLIEVSQYHAAA